MGWAFDLDGVIWRGSAPVAGSAQAVSTLSAAGVDVVFVTNMSAVEPREVEARLAGQGIDGRDRVVTSAMAAATQVEPGMRILSCAGDGVRVCFEDRGVTVVDCSDPDARSGDFDAVVVGWHRSFDYERMSTAANAVWNGARLIGTNDDPTYPSSDGLLPGNGAILASIVAATGAVAEVAGKPHSPIVDLVRARVGDSGVMVGDRADTDGGFARALGYRFVLVLTGVTSREDLPVDPAPDLVVADAATAVREWFPSC